MQNVALLYYTIKKIQRFEDRVIWRVYGRFSRAITPFFSPGIVSVMVTVLYFSRRLFVFVHSFIAGHLSN